MAAGRERMLSDEALDRLARRFFSEVRAEHPAEKPIVRASRSDVSAESGAGGDLLGWLFSDNGSDASSCDGSD